MLGVRQKQQQRKWRLQGEGVAPSLRRGAQLRTGLARPSLGGPRPGGLTAVAPTPAAHDRRPRSRQTTASPRGTRGSGVRVRRRGPGPTHRQPPDNTRAPLFAGRSGCGCRGADSFPSLLCGLPPPRPAGTRAEGGAGRSCAIRRAGPLRTVRGGRMEPAPRLIHNIRSGGDAQRGRQETN